MYDSIQLQQFSDNRLGGEPVPEDLRILFLHRNELERRTAIALSAKKDWAPWLDTSYLSEAEKADPEIAANIRAIAEVWSLGAFVATSEDEEYIGYWRGPQRRAVADSPLIYLDNEGQFYSCAGSNLAEALLARTYGEDSFKELCDWMRSIGIAIPEWRSREAIPYSEDVEPSPGTLHEEFYYRFCGR
jgi:hypothetical protein